MSRNFARSKAFDLAKLRDNKVTSVEKSNVMETGMFWKNTVSNIHQKEFQDVELFHMLADNCAMQLVRNPKQFDVILTDNLFGDLLSDIAAMLTGSLGMLPSASLGPVAENGSRAAMYEPVHGSAPDIAGQGKANPLAMIMSFAMMLKYSFNMQEDSVLVENAVQAVLSKGLRTADISDGADKIVSTQDMGKALPISWVDTILSAPSLISAVLKPFDRTACTAFSTKTLSSCILKLYFNIMAKLIIIASGFALPCPAISGALP